MARAISSRRCAPYGSAAGRIVGAGQSDRRHPARSGRGRWLRARPGTWPPSPNTASRPLTTDGISTLCCATSKFSSTRHAGEQADVLKRARDPAHAGDPMARHALQRTACRRWGAECDAARGRPVEPGDAVEHCGLAGPVGADDRGDLARAARRTTTRRPRSARRTAWSDPAPPAMATSGAALGDQVGGYLLRPCRAPPTASGRTPGPAGGGSSSAPARRRRSACGIPQGRGTSLQPPIITIAASATPSWLPRPPSTTIASTVALSMKVKLSGLMKAWRVAKNAPAKPPKQAPMANAVSLVIGDVDAERAAGHLVLPQCLPGPAQRQRGAAERDPVGQQGEAEDDVIEENHALADIRLDAEKAGERAGSAAHARR